VNGRIEWRRTGPQAWRAVAGGAVLVVWRSGDQKWTAVVECRDAVHDRFRSRPDAQRWASAVAEVLA
jgi:hypothetical protein